MIKKLAYSSFTKIASCLAMTAMLYSCAQVVPLSGGDKDVDPPKEVESNPKNASVNFDAKTITIEFDEYIQLNNVNSQLIVSPIIKPTPQVQVKGKKLVIKLQDSLETNTTYSFNFGNAITDITENNVFPNYKYVFSTGSYIDSLSYSGTVVNAFDLKVEESVYVLLYDQLEDSVPYKQLPRYVAMTDKTGNFSITNIAAGNYKLFAIKDINSNYKFDLPNEQIGYSSENITIENSTSDHQIYLFEEADTVQYVVKASNKSFGKLDIILNLPTKDLRIVPLNMTPRDSWYVEEKNETGDSITLWLTATNNLDNLEIELADGEGIIDTIDVKLMKELEDTSFAFASNLRMAFDLNQPIIITSKYPFKESVKWGVIQLFEDSVSQKIPFSFKKPGLKNVSFNYSFKEDAQYQFYIPAGTFEDIYGLENDTLKVDFRTKKLADYGILMLALTVNFEEQYILQLFKNKRLVKEQYLTGNQNLTMEYLTPGDYTMKLIIDANGDKKWNTGNYIKGIQPEKVIIYEKEIKMRANWDNEIKWMIRE